MFARMPQLPLSGRADGSPDFRSRSQVWKQSTRATFSRMEGTMQREGSPWRGMSVVFLKELSDHLTGARMIVLALVMVITAVVSVYFAIGQIKESPGEYRYLFLYLFTQARAPWPSLV